MDNRSNILACALNLFATRGYDAASVQEIVEAAGITKPTLYHYFGSKQGLLQAVLDENFNPLEERLRQAAVYQGDLTGVLKKIAGVYFSFASHHPTFYRMQLAMWFAPAESEALKAVAARNEEQHRLIEELFIRAARDHGNMRGRHQAYAATFIGMLHTYIGMALNGYLSLNDELVHQAVHQFEHGIYS